MPKRSNSNNIKELSDRDWLCKAKAIMRFIYKHHLFNPKNGSLIPNKKTDFIKKKIYEITWYIQGKKFNFHLKMVRHFIGLNLYLCPICKNPKTFMPGTRKFYIPDLCQADNKEHNRIRKNLQLKKAKKTWQKKYGKRNPMMVDSIKKKNLNSHYKHFGGHFFQSDDFKKLNIKNFLADLEIQGKIKKTNLKKYGVDNPFKSKEIQDKIKKTNLKKYGVEYPAQKHISNKEKISKNFLKKFLNNTGEIQMDKIKKYFNITESTVYKLFHRYKITFKPTYNHGGFNPDKPAILYYLYDPQEDLYKIGITNLTVEERFGKTFCSNRAIAILEQKAFDEGINAYLAEQEILETFSYARYQNPSWPEEKGGRTEFFNYDILQLNKNKDNCENPEN